MLDQVKAREVVRVAPNGATEPLVCRCARSNGDLIDVYVKFSWQECAGSALAAEIICSQLARIVGITSPEAVLVGWCESFLTAVNLANRRHWHIAKSSVIPTFGSVSVGPGAIAGDPGLIEDSRFSSKCLEIWIFDAIVGNFDRNLRKPNSVVKDGTLFAIDHEKALNFGLRKLAPTILDPEWPKYDGHLFDGVCSLGVSSLEIESIVERYTSIPEEELLRIGDLIPSAWGVSGFVNAALSYLAEIPEKRSVLTNNLKRVLQ